MECLFIMASYQFLTNQDILLVIEEVVERFLIPRFLELDMNASGEWIKSLEVIARNNNEAVIRGRDYTYYLVRGRGPNQDQSVEALRRWAVWAGNTFIKEWVKNKGIAADPIAVAMSIAKKGTSWKRKGGSNLLEVLTEPDTIQFIEQKIRMIVQPKVVEALQRNANDAFRNI